MVTLLLSLLLLSVKSGKVTAATETLIIIDWVVYLRGLNNRLSDGLNNWLSGRLNYRLSCRLRVVFFLLLSLKG